jgi:hypothetical protein
MHGRELATKSVSPDRAVLPELAELLGNKRLKILPDFNRSLQLDVPGAWLTA